MLREELDQVEERIRSLRGEKARARKTAEAAKAALAESESASALAAAEQAVAAVRDVDAQIEEAHEQQVNLLRRLGDHEAGRSGFTTPRVSGYAEAARRINLAAGVDRIDLPAASLLRQEGIVAQAGSVGGSAVSPPVIARTPVERSARGEMIYPVFPQQEIDAGDLAITDFVVSFAEPSGTGLTGVERDPVATDAKQDLGATLAAATPATRQFAVFEDAIPVKLLDNRPALQAYLELEMRRQLDLAVDRHVIAKINAAGPPTGSTGATTIERVRNAVAAARNNGASPSVLAINPTDAAALDLSTTGADDAFVFATRASGSSSPLWSLQIRESPAVAAGDLYVLDPSRLGVLYAGSGSILVDPYFGMANNLVRLRIEVEAYLHIRNFQSAYLIS